MSDCFPLELVVFGLAYLAFRSNPMSPRLMLCDNNLVLPC